MSMINITANSIVSRRISSYNFKRILLTYVPMILLDVLTGASSSAGFYHTVLLYTDVSYNTIYKSHYV